MEEQTLNFAQQHNIFEACRARPVTVIGAGSVGSMVVPMLVKIGVTDLTVWDGDDLESHNLPMSLTWRKSDIGRVKVLALEEIVREQSGVGIKTIPRMYAGEPLRDAVVACVDTMEARQAIWKAVKMTGLTDILIDTRIAAEFVSVFAVNPSDPDDIEYYEYFLRYGSGEAVKPTCGLHGIVYVAADAAKAVLADLTNLWMSGRKERHYQKLVGQLPT
jgi:molybdopterin/thiamine biosynthesis adenylyltransferase